MELLISLACATIITVVLTPLTYLIAYAWSDGDEGTAAAAAFIQSVALFCYAVWQAL